MLIASIDNVVELFLNHGALYGFLFVASIVGVLAVGFTVKHVLNRLMSQLRVGHLGVILAWSIGFCGVLAAGMLFFGLIEPLDKVPQANVRAWIHAMIMSAVFVCCALLSYWLPATPAGEDKSDQVPSA